MIYRKTNSILHIASQARRSLDQQIEWDEQRRAQLRAQGQEPMQA